MSESAPGHDDWTSGLSWGSARFTLHGNYRGDQIWLKNFLTPWFEFEDIGEGRSITFTHDRVRYDQLLQAFRTNRQVQHACFSLDSQIIRYPGWSQSEGEKWAWDEFTPCFIGSRDNQIEVVIPPGVVFARIGFVRIIRELMWQELAESQLAVHAAALSVADVGMLIIGPKKAGKTTLLTYLLSHPRSNFVSNDWCMISRRNESLSVRGVPTLLRLREGTRSLLSTTTAKLVEPLNIFVNNHKELETTVEPPPKPGPEGELILTPVNFARRLQRPISPSARLGLLLFPTRDQREFIRPIRGEELEVRLKGGLYGQPGYRPAQTILGGNTPACRFGPNDLSKVPAYEVSLTPHSFQNHEMVQSVFKLALEGGD